VPSSPGSKKKSNNKDVLQANYSPDTVHNPSRTPGDIPNTTGETLQKLICSHGKPSKAKRDNQLPIGAT